MHSSSHHNRIDLLLNWHKYDEAIREAEDWIRECPAHAEAYAILAAVYLKKGAEYQAVHWAKEAFNIEPENAIAWRTLAGAYYHKQEWERFNAAAAEGMRIFPWDTYFPYLMSNAVLAKGGDFQQARQYLEACLKLQPDNAIYLANYSYVLANLKETVESLRMQDQALQLEPDDARVFFNLAWAADSRKDHKTAINFLTQAVRLDPENTQVLEEYLRILRKQYWIYRALPSVHTSNKIHPRHFLLLFFGMIYCLPLFFVRDRFPALLAFLTFYAYYLLIGVCVISAISLIRQAIKIAVFIQVYGWNLTSAGFMTKADTDRNEVQTLQDGIRLNPENTGHLKNYLVMMKNRYWFYAVLNHVRRFIQESISQWPFWLFLSSASYLFPILRPFFVWFVLWCGLVFVLFGITNLGLDLLFKYKLRQSQVKP